MTEKLLVLNDLSAEKKTELIDRFKTVEFSFTNPKDVTDEELARATIIWGNLHPKRLHNQLDKLKWIQLCSAGYDAYSKPDLLPEQTTLTNAKGAYGLTVAEHTLATTMMAMRKLHLYHKNQLTHNWKNEGKIKSIYGSKVGIIGLGDIGRNIAEKFSGLGSEIVGFYKSDKVSFPFVKEVRTVDNIADKVSDLDVLILCVPAMASNYHLVDSKLLANMKSDAILVNVGRGSLVDLEALCTHMKHEDEFAAVLDVTEPEPLPENHEAWDLKNIIITPHVAGGFDLDETFNKYMEIAENNLEKFLKEDPLSNVVIKGF
ncbi:D-2-hydroxyacid dehydrogenase [Vagococcus sp. PNs007]|uniref:D-2-hydroxyacid dehydrogenase n=1 Tax=Vagococcus proximus TaxID=2991417 RepID=A0ABT5WZ09_9ENTE|nr:D-2-hydroxyacid dehydrogenase [Vagococcus proximus]MDF0478997.1 D-2-hydroxyacid dehydrogenase [Vagococcus proximus]